MTQKRTYKVKSEPDNKTIQPGQNNVLEAKLDAITGLLKEIIELMKQKKPLTSQDLFGRNGRSG